MRVTIVDDRCRLFFRLFLTISIFSIFPKKVIGPDASENVLDRPEGSGRPSWGIRGGPGGLLGGPGALRGGVRGASWGGLGRSWGDLGPTFKAVHFPIVFLIDFERQKGAQREAFWEPKWSQNRSQNDSKSKSIFKSEEIPFKTVLEPSWSRLGPILGHLHRA
jgi:hypothetical protein